jgi:hypothetical protein
MRLEEGAMDGRSEELIFRALGEAVVRSWSKLPQAMQHDLFEQAVVSQGEFMRQQLAVFLHERHTRTTDTLKARAILETDSLGG